jgi:predicted Rossmann-fold nucleotide-binding protein
MEAVCRGAAEAGGTTRGVVLAGRGEANAWVREATVASDLGDRLRILRDSSDAWIFLPHGLGTMLELLWIAESVVKNEATPRPFVLVGEFWRALLGSALAEAASPAGAKALRDCVHFASTVPEAASAALGSA